MYQKGDRVKAEDLNRMLSLLADGFSAPSFVSSTGEQVQKPNYNAFDEVIIRPNVAMPVFSAFMPEDQSSYNADVKRPFIKLKQNAHLRHGSLPYFTNGSIALDANEDGWGQPMIPGRWYWVQATDDVRGICGLDNVDFKLKLGLPGFYAGGFATIDGVKCGIVTPYHTPIFARHKSGAGAGAMGVFELYKTNNERPGGGGTPGITLTTVEYEAYNPGPTAITLNAKCYLFPCMGMYFAVEIC